MQVVQDLAMEAGISDLLGFQLYRFALSRMEPPLDVSAPLSWMMPLLSRKPLQIRTDSLGRPMRIQENPSFVWIFAMIMLQPGLLGKMTGLKPHQIHPFSSLVCEKFYEETKALLPKPKEVKAMKEDHSQRRSILIENLMTIYFLTSYHTVQARYIANSVTIMQELASGPDHITAKTDWAQFSEQVALYIKLLSYSEKYNPAVGIVLHSKLGLMFISKTDDAFMRVAMLLCFMFELNRAVEKEGWAHLRDYSRYWLEKLGVGCEG